MAFLSTIHDHSLYAHNTGVSAGLTSDPAKVIAGTGSLRVTRGTTNFAHWHCARTSPPSRFPNFYGTLRCRVLTSIPNSGTIGIYALASQDDVSTSGSFYGCELLFYGTNVMPQIAFYTSGVDGTPLIENVIAGTAVAYPLGTIYSLACQVLNGPTFGGIVLKYWVAVGPDLPDITTPPTLTGTFAASGVRPTFGEGEYGRINDFNNNAELIIDQVGRYALLVP